MSKLTIIRTKLLKPHSAPWHAGSNTGDSIWNTEPLSQDHILERNEEITHASKKNKLWTVINGHLSYDRPEPLPPLYEQGRRDIDWVLRHMRLGWPAYFERIAASGDPTAVDGSYTGPGGYSNTASLTAVTGGAVNVAWWTPLTYSPFPSANGMKAPSSFRLTAGGLITSSASAQTITMNPAIGTAVAGQALGASSALALGSTITNAFWRGAYDVIVRTTGTAGTVVGNGLMHWGTTAGASATVSNALLGGGNTVATADFVTTQQGLLFAATPSAAGVSVTPTMVQWASWG